MATQKVSRASSSDGDSAEDVRSELAQLRSQVTALELWRAHQSDLIDNILNGQQRGSDLVDVDDTDLGDGLAVWTPGFKTSCAIAITGMGADMVDELADWVHEHVCAVLARPLRGEIKWCPQWWEHPEAVFRLAALRGAWTELSREPGAGMSIYIRDHLDPCLPELTSPIGPFADCTYNERHRISGALTSHQPLPTLPTATRRDPPRPAATDQNTRARAPAEPCACSSQPEPR